MIPQLNHLLRLLFSQSYDTSWIPLSLQGIYNANSSTFNEQVAVEWAQGFVFPVDIAKRDDTSLKKCQSILNMCSQVQAERRQRRFNQERIRSCVPQDYKHFNRLIELCDGVRVFTSPEFVPNAKRKKPPLNKTYQIVNSCVHKQIMALWLKKLVFIVSLTDFLAQENVHLNILSWAKNSGKPQGRVILNPSNISYSALNGVESRDMAELHYGPIVHPTINSLIQMLLRFIDKTVLEKSLSGHDGEEFCLFKHDLKGAFTLLEMRPSDASLVAAELTNDNVVIWSSGGFGLTSTPFAFNCITNVIRDRLRVICNMLAELDIYVDDIMGITLRRNLAKIRALIEEFVTLLLGPGSIEPSKSLEGSRLVFLGYTVDLNTRSITISDINFQKCAYLFLSVDVRKKVQIKTLQTIASLASRYCLVLRELKSVTNAFYKNFAGMRNDNAFVEWHPDAVAAVWLWRIVLLNLHLQEEKYSRPFESFRTLDASIVLCFDSSLTGIGVVIRSCGGLTNEGSVILGEVLSVTSVQYCDLPTPIDFNMDSSYQNLSEFIGVVVGLILIRGLHLEHVGIHLVGDSVTALTWSESERFRGVLTRPAALIFLHLCIKFGFEVVGTTHISSEDNHVCDKLSRGQSPLSACEEYGWPPECATTVSPLSMKCISLCGLQHSFLDIESLVSFWSSLKHLV